ncbi:MAG: hypothetical protein F4166_10235 [Gammaproteobacteria bacterium]|nr:hypothetical protein [Gammaproteobacteria bacterium]
MRSVYKTLRSRNGPPNVTFGNTVTVNIVVSATNLGGTTEATIPLTITPYDLRPQLKHNLDAIPTRYSAEDRIYEASVFRWVRHNLVGIANPTLAFQDNYTVPSFISLERSRGGGKYLRVELPKITTETTYNIKLKATNEDGDFNFIYPLVVLPIPDGVTHTGDFTKVGDVPHFGANIYARGLTAFGTTLYTLGTDRTAGRNSGVRYLYKINPTTGIATKIGDVAHPSLYAICFLGDTLYGLEARHLVTINTSTGVTSRVNPTDIWIPDVHLTLFAHNGTLYGYYVSRDMIYTIDTSTGIYTLVYEDFDDGSNDIYRFTTIGDTIFAAGQHHIKLVNLDIEKALMIGNHRVSFWSREKIVGLASIGNTLYLCKSWDGGSAYLYSSAVPHKK